MKKHTLRILDTTGDTEISWDPTDDASLKQARDLFDEATSQGRYAYKTRSDKTHEVIKNFDSKAGEIVVAAKLVGG